MNKDDAKKIKNRIEALRLEYEAIQKKIGLLRTEGHRIHGAIKELTLVLEHLSPKKKEKRKKNNKEG